MRLPTAITNETTRGWEATPPGWFFGTWYFTHSNQENYFTFRNMQWTVSKRNPNDLDDSLNDLTTFQILNSTDNTVWEIYGIDTPAIVQGAPERDSYYFNPTGELAFGYNKYEFIAWGYDRDGVAWFVMSETVPGDTTTLATLDIGSRSDKGPNEETMELIREAMVQLGNEELLAVMSNVTKLVQDGGRTGQLWPACNATCQTNGKFSLFNS
jgi:hypothetical protein